MITVLQIILKLDESVFGTKKLKTSPLHDLILDIASIKNLSKKKIIIYLTVNKKKSCSQAFLRPFKMFSVSHLVFKFLFPKSLILLYKNIMLNYILIVGMYLCKIIVCVLERNAFNLILVHKLF